MGKSLEMNICLNGFFVLSVCVGGFQNFAKAYCFDFLIILIFLPETLFCPMSTIFRVRHSTDTVKILISMP
jgi:hypothetical protein